MSHQEQRYLQMKRTLSGDKTLLPIIISGDLPKLTFSNNICNSLIRSVVYQQLSTKSADAIYSRFLALLGSSEYDSLRVLNYSVEQLRSVGLSNQKANYIQNIVRFFDEENLLNFDWSQLSDEEIIVLLSKIKGVGKWTVQMLLIFTLHRSDVFPHDDLAIKKAMCKLYELDMEDKELIKKMTFIAENWRPFRSYASRYMWIYLND